MSGTLVADRIFFGGDVITMDEARPTAEAVAIEDGIIVAVGSKSDVMALKGPSTESVDLRGRTLVRSMQSAPRPLP